METSRLKNDQFITKILLVEDQDLIRQGVAALLSLFPNFKIIGEGAQNGEEAIQQVRDYEPDIVLMDISMPKMDGIEATSEIKKRYPATKVLILTIENSEQNVAKCMRVGADGYILKNTRQAELVEAIETVVAGKTYLDGRFDAAKITSYTNGETLLPLDLITRREKEILQFIAAGNKNQEIADQLNISIKTVETHRANLMRKLNLKNTAAVTAFALKEGL